MIADLSVRCAWKHSYKMSANLEKREVGRKERFGFGFGLACSLTDLKHAAVGYFHAHHLFLAALGKPFFNRDRLTRVFDENSHRTQVNVASPIAGFYSFSHKRFEPLHDPPESRAPKNRSMVPRFYIPFL